jgi:alpha-L-fucosidase
LLADIVSKNGNLLLNVVLYPDGSLPPESQALLSDLKEWMGTNREAIHGTRPWTVFGEGPTQTAAGAFKENADYTAADIRFTSKGRTVYAITLGEPRGQVAIASFGRSGGHAPRGVRAARLLGVPKALKFQQTDAALIVDVPDRLPTRHASVIALTLA